MTYTQTEVESIKTLCLNLVAMNHIKIDELDAWGNPIPLYTAEAKRQLVAAIKKCSGMDWSGTIQNAFLDTAVSYQQEIARAACGEMSDQMVMGACWAHMHHEIDTTVLLELTESLFTPAQIIEMLVTHVDYLDLLQDAKRRGRLEDDETKDQHFCGVAA